MDPCPGACGSHATCRAQNHFPSCSCDPGYTGDPFSACYRKTTCKISALTFIKYVITLILVPPKIEIVDPCNPSPCGSNAVCSKQRSAAACQCIQDYFGDPYISCRPECVVHSDCPSNKACKRNKCIDPCPGTCGINAKCQVRNHIPICICIENFIGDPFTACKQKPLGN